ncbi:hypothetical protein DZF91_07545 [Actinomadura logoneensis]|uniref:Uncharacterized protein n=1 Tax=Actinomadura logoneensis TaxID=2293572 RepID=A0A372JQK8_9ACTN|nr:hypothetical protein [Actinomadura logoneensis]RFU42260.1 hypothetical protein DZF91_07545 [Actinomadura logoneensis]
MITIPRKSIGERLALAIVMLFLGGLTFLCYLSIRHGIHDLNVHSKPNYSRVTCDGHVMEQNDHCTVGGGLYDTREMAKVNADRHDHEVAEYGVGFILLGGLFGVPLAFATLGFFKEMVEP